MPVDKIMLLTFMENELGVKSADVTDTDPLFSSGVIDSFSLVSMITFIEKTAGFRVNPIDVNLDNMDTIERILSYIERMQTA